MSVPRRLATCQMLSLGSASTSRPSRVKRIVSVIASMLHSRQNHPQQPLVAGIEGVYEGQAVEVGDAWHIFREDRPAACASGSGPDQRVPEWGAVSDADPQRFIKVPFVSSSHIHDRAEARHRFDRFFRSATMFVGNNVEELAKCLYRL